MLENLGIGSRINHSQYGDGVVINEKSATYTISYIQHGLKELSKTDEANVTIIDQLDPDNDLVSLFDVERILTSVVKKYIEYPETVELGQKWKGGKMILQPGDRSLAVKEIPVEQFFHKIVMARDRMRTLEQRINANSALTDEEKVNLQQYITKIYGSLTTFNLFFKNKEDYFTGEKSDY
jgi:isochorismate synthase EntC